ncbi:MAG: chemotaxis protein CheA, partial [Pseudophaeobacter sp.]
TQTEEDDSEAASTIDMEADANDEDISRVLDRLDLTGELAGADNAPEETATKEAEAEETATEEEGDALLGAPSDAAVADQDTVQDADSAQEQVSRPKRGMRRLPVVDANVQQAEPEASVAADAAQTAPPEEAESPAEARPTAAPLRARIVKMKRADLEQAMATGNLEEVEEDGVESSLDADDEAELMRELAEVEADLLASNQEDEADPAESVAEAEALAEKEAQEETQAVSAPVAEAPAETRDTAAPSPDSDVSRLMAAAESKLGDPDNATSRETYSHLRAAVAAAEADRSAGDHSAQADEAEAYREDLANVVRPRRPGSNAGAGGGAKAPRPRSGGERPAPLKLVAEQRIDPAPEAASSKPVRPRRISTPVEEPAAQAGTEGSFSDYAQDRGAVELPELLEAAASYLSFVEGRDHFSRPQLMSKVRSVGHADFNRENGLRSFGQLLRDGKIERANNGHFSATDDIGFRPPERAAG